MMGVERWISLNLFDHDADTLSIKPQAMRRISDKPSA